MILATKPEVDEAKRALAEEVDEAAAAIARWQADPTDKKRLTAADNTMQRATAAFAEYEQVLKTWAAGPDSTAPSTVGQQTDAAQ
jgi:hypothetical protein